MVSSQSKYQFYQEASLSQKLAYKMPEYSDYAGADPEISLTIALLNHLHNEKMIDLENDPKWKFIKGLLNEQRKALFATSDKVNEISKMGMQMPKAEDEFYGTDDDSD